MIQALVKIKVTKKVVKHYKQTHKGIIKHNYVSGGHRERVSKLSYKKQNMYTNNPKWSHKEMQHISKKLKKLKKNKTQ